MANGRPDCPARLANVAGKAIFHPLRDILSKFRPIITSLYPPNGLRLSNMRNAMKHFENPFAERVWH